MRKYRKLFNHLCECNLHFNAAFSFPSLAVLSTKIATMTCSLFLFIRGLLYPDSGLKDAATIMAYTALVECLQMFIIFTSADIPVKQVIIIAQYFTNIMCSILIAFLGSTPQRGCHRHDQSARVHCGSIPEERGLILIDSN